MGEEQKELPSMSDDERRGFVGKLFVKLGFVKNLQASGLNVRAAEEAVKQQIRDTLQTGDPQKA